MKSRNPEQPIACGFWDLDGKTIKKREIPKVANFNFSAHVPAGSRAQFQLESRDRYPEVAVYIDIDGYTTNDVAINDVLETVDSLRDQIDNSVAGVLEFTFGTSLGD